MTRLARPTRRRALAVAAAVLVPLAFTGLAAAAFAGGDEQPISRIPAAVVNADQMVTTTAEDGTETPVLAGRQLVTELTAPDAEGFDWRITNAEDAEQALADGDVQVVITVPEDFSAAILSTQGDDPRQAEIDIRTDDAHSYLSGPVAQAIGEGMVSAFGSTITEQVVGGLYGALGQVGGALGEAAGGAGQLADGAEQSAAGAQELASGSTASAAGAEQLAGGVAAYVGGAGQLAGGLGQLEQGLRGTPAAPGLPDAAAGVTAYTQGVSAISAQLDQAAAALAIDPLDPVALGTVQALAPALAQAAAQGPALSQGLTAAADGAVSGAAQSAAGARELAAEGAQLTAGARELAGGLTQLSAGTGELATGLDTLADGSRELATGLETGAAQVPSGDEDQVATAAEVVADPVEITLTRDNEVTELGQMVATFLVPIGLWIGALATLVVLPPLSRRVLASTAGTGRLLLAGLRPAAILAAAQAAALVALLHLALGVDWALLPATVGLSLVIALAFTAVHALLVAWLGRAGMLVSLLLLALQLASLGGLVPVQALAEPFSSLAGVLPLGIAVTAMQQVIAGGAAAPVISGVVGLVLVALVATALSGLALRRARRASTLGLVPA